MAQILEWNSYEIPEEHSDQWSRDKLLLLTKIYTQTKETFQFRKLSGQVTWNIKASAKDV